MSAEKQSASLDEEKDERTTTELVVAEKGALSTKPKRMIENLGTNLAMNFDEVEHFMEALVLLDFDNGGSDDEEVVDKNAFCRTCGDKIKDLETFQKNKDHHCKECTSLTSLGILKKNKLKFTTDFYEYVVFSVLFSPIIWIWIPLFDASTTLYLAVIVIYLIVASLGLTLFLRRLIREKVISLNQIPLGLIPVTNYVYIMMIATLIPNILIIAETLRVYSRRDINVIFECRNMYRYVVDTADSDSTTTTTASPFGTFDIVYEYPTECLLYAQLLSNAMIVFVSSVLINLLIMREVKYDGQKSWKQLKNDEIPECHKSYQFYPKLEKRYYAIHKFKRSAVPTVQMFWKRHNKFSTAWWMAVLQTLCTGTFCLIICCNGFYILGDAFMDRLVEHKAMLIPVIISVITSFVMFSLLFVSFYELSWVFHKAYAVMSVSTPPLKDANKLYQDMTVKYEVHGHGEANKDVAVQEDDGKKDEVAMVLYDEEDINLNDIKIWWDLRSYAFRTLALFYEISDPIMSTLVLAVLGLTAYLLYELYVTFEEDVDLLKLTITKDPIQFTFVVITGVVIYKSYKLLLHFLRPYSELYGHIYTAKQQVLSIQFEIVNEQKNSKRKGYLNEVVSLYGKLISQMSEDAKNKAPTILGIKVTRTKLAALRSYIISFIVIFVGSVWQSWFNAADTLSA